MDQITSQIFIGDWLDGKDLVELKNNKISGILNVCPDNAAEGQALQYVFIPLGDGPGNNFKDFERAVFELDDMIKENMKVLVHCHAGQSRSVSVVASWLSWRGKVDLLSSLNFIAQKRPQISPCKAMLEMCQQFIEKWSKQK